MGESVSMATWKKAIFQPSLQEQPGSGGKGAYCGTLVPTVSSSDWTDILVQAHLQGIPTVKQPWL